jgi:aspartate/methionine/tyrosine aminotransferase
MQMSPFRLERYFAQYEFTAPYLLCSSDCESFSVGELLDLTGGSRDEVYDVWLGYTESQGAPWLRQEISSLYTTVQPDDILVHSGAQEAIFTFANAVLQRGDHVIVHWPCYQSLFEVAHSLGCRVTRWETRQEDNWDLDLDFLKANLRDNTKAVFVNCPHNPTGYLMTEEKLLDLDRLSKEHGFVVFSDEVYRLLEYRDEDRLPAWCDINPAAVSLGVMSKAFGLAGLRIGWIATQNRDVYQRMARFKDYTTICNSAPSEFLASKALRQREEILARNRGIISHNLKLLNRFFADHSDRFEWHMPKAGPIAFPALVEGNVEEFCHQLVSQAGILLLPGTVYDKAYTGNFRIGFGRKNLPEVLARLEEFLHHAA